jgi:hypothetical protein
LAARARRSASDQTTTLFDGGPRAEIWHQYGSQIAHIGQLALDEDEQATGAEDAREAPHEIGVVRDVHDHGLDVDEVCVSLLHERARSPKVLSGHGSGCVTSVVRDALMESELVIDEMLTNGVKVDVAVRKLDGLREGGP